jgi:hypothetical protein
MIPEREPDRWGLSDRDAVTADGRQRVGAVTAHRSGIEEKRRS